MSMIRTCWQNLSRNHAAFAFYLALMVVLLLGVYTEAGASYLRINLLYVFLLVAAYVFCSATLLEPLNQLAQRFHNRCERAGVKKPLTRALDIIVLLFPFLYFASVGYVPFVRMMFMDDYYAASGLRQVFFDALPTWANYGGEYFLRGIAPLWLVYCFVNRRRIFYPALLLTSLQALGIITKASIVILLFPLLVVQCHARAWKHAALTAGIITVMLMLNVTVLHHSALTTMAKTEAQKVIDAKNKQKILAERKAFEEHPSAITQFLQTRLEPSDANRTVIEEYKSLELAAEGIWIRLFAVQGRIVKQWIDTYPGERGFQHGCGYRWYAAMAGCAFVKLPLEVWLKYFAELKQDYGLVGTVSAPHYINAYANFGDDGVILSAIGMAMLLVALNAIFTHAAYNFAFNASFLGLALQAPLFSLLNSSGWALTILLYLLFFPRGSQNH